MGKAVMSAALTVKLMKPFIEAGVKRVERRSYNPRIVNLPMAGALYLTRAYRGNALYMARREAMRMSKDSLGGGWVGVLYEDETMGWTVQVGLADFARLMAHTEELERRAA